LFRELLIFKTKHLCEIVINVCTDRTANSAVHGRW